MANKYPHLLSPQKIGNIVVRNRLVSSAHITRLARGRHPTQEMIEYHATRAKGGIGLIILEGTAVHPTAVFDDSTALAAWDQQSISSFNQLSDAIHQNGSTVFAQLLHMGRGANGMASMRPLWSASSVPGWLSSELTHSMTKSEIKEVTHFWAKCALNMKQASMDGVEIHGGHGYLIQQFLSPLTNHRKDEYGVSLACRARFALEVCQAVRQAVGSEFVVGIRLSADEMVAGGLTVDDMSKVARWLEETGHLDYISVSHSTSTDPLSFAKQVADMTWSQAPFIHFAKQIKEATKGIPIFGVCRIVNPDVAENIIANGSADMVCMTRAHIADPDIGLKLKENRAADIRPCIGCNQGCAERTWFGQTIGCLVNPEAGNELKFGSIESVSRPRSVVVVGGGPAGMEAARVAALRGHRVALFERHHQLGGQLRIAINAPNRLEFSMIINWLQNQLEILGVSIKLGLEMTPELLMQEDPDAVIVATGSTPELPVLPGLNLSSGPQLASPEDLLSGKVKTGNRTLILDADNHHKAASTAEFAADHCSEVFFVTRAASISSEIAPHSQAPLIHRLKNKRINFITETWINGVSGNSVMLNDIYNNNVQQIDHVDLIIAAMPNTSETSLHESLAATNLFDVSAAGDCVAPRRAIEAIREGYLIGRSI